MTAIVDVHGSPVSSGNGERRTIYLQAGQLTAASDSEVIVTILGSCVAICLWDTRLRLGGMNHYMLPFPTTKQNVSPRFGTVAWTQLLHRVSDLGAQRPNLRAGIFGGACIMDAFRDDADHVGVRNVGLAEEQLRDAGIAVVQREVGGRRGRKLTFDTRTGHITVREL
jgi:chemotaxis protein CheD